MFPGMFRRGKQWLLVSACGIGCGLTIGLTPIAIAQTQASKTKAPTAGKAPSKTGGASKNNGGAKALEFSEDDDGNIGEPGVAPANTGKGKMRPPAGSPNSVRPSGQRPPDQDEGEGVPVRPTMQKSGQQKAGPQGQANRPRTGGPQGAPDPNAIIPCPFRALAPNQQKELDELLAKWEERSGGIERFQCEFDRWEYDPVFGPADPETAKTFGTGDLKYATPDKGLFKVNTIKVWTLPVGEDGKPVPGAKGEYEKKAGIYGEHWICDGKSVFSFDYRQKVIKKIPLPPDMQGKKIVDGPLPFLFGAKAETLKKRYWMRVTTPANVGNQYWIEVWPKYVGDRQNFHHITVILSAKEFLPDAMEVCDSSFVPKTKEMRTVYAFKNREVNWTVSAIEKLNLFHKEFYEPQAKFGWTIKVEEYAPPDAETVQRPQPPAEPAKKKKG